MDAQKLNELLVGKSSSKCGQNLIYRHLQSCNRAYPDIVPDALTYVLDRTRLPKHEIVPMVLSDAPGHIEQPIPFTLFCYSQPTVFFSHTKSAPVWSCLVCIAQVAHTIPKKRISHIWSTKRNLFAKPFHGWV